VEHCVKHPRCVEGSRQPDQQRGIGRRTEERNAAKLRVKVDLRAVDGHDDLSDERGDGLSPRLAGEAPLELLEKLERRKHVSHALRRPWRAERQRGRNGQWAKEGLLRV